MFFFLASRLSCAYLLPPSRWAADTIVDALINGDVSARSMKRYHDKWYGEWGHEFYWSMKMSLLMYRCPVMLDAAAKLIGRRGARFLADWAQVMTGAASKLWFLRPDVG
jgi:flavin-dependent dehydrogenase